MAQTGYWNYVPAGATSVTAMEWRKVLDSPYREMIRKEIPAPTLQLLSGINFIEGIDRVVVAGSGKFALIVLNGKFDRSQLKELAVSDGGTVKAYKNAELLLSPDADAEAETQIALISETVVLIGDKDSLIAAIDGAGGPKKPVRSGGFDLWIFAKSPTPEIKGLEFGLYIRDGAVQMDVNAQTTAVDYARSLAENARLFGLGSVQDGTAVRISGKVEKDEFEKKAGVWRTSLEELRAPPEIVKKAEEPTGPMKVRIYGLDDGPKEIPYPNPK
jgi:hypothetical protein